MNFTETLARIVTLGRNAEQRLVSLPRSNPVSYKFEWNHHFFIRAGGLFFLYLKQEGESLEVNEFEKSAYCSV